METKFKAEKKLTKELLGSVPVLLGLASSATGVQAMRVPLSGYLRFLDGEARGQKKVKQKTKMKQKLSVTIDEKTIEVIENMLKTVCLETNLTLLNTA